MEDVSDNVERSLRQADRGDSSAGPDAPPHVPQGADVFGRVVHRDPDIPPSPSVDEEDELAERFQKLGIKKLEKIKEQKNVAEAKRKQILEEFKCFHTIHQGDRCKRHRLWKEGLLGRLGGILIPSLHREELLWVGSYAF